MIQNTCDFAKARYLDISRLRRLWGYLWIILGTSVALFLCLSIIFFLRSNWLAAALSTLGTLVDGAAMTWITTQRTAAANEEEKAFAELVLHCGPPAGPKFAAADALRESAQTITQTPWFQQLRSAARSAEAAKILLNGLRND